ncbi:MAG TPA: hypothetical protein VH083_24535 [Myxococcales bacterium]|jgi:hypothetical protein|nr:hypothetical protein [Myxococcales bacterium]
MRRLVGCLGLVLAAACGGSSSGGGGSVAPGNDGGVIAAPDGGAVVPPPVTPDAGTVTPPATDGGTAAPPATDGGTAAPPPIDGGTASSSCDGISPIRVGAPSGTHAASADQDGFFACSTAVNGSGALALSRLSHNFPNALKDNVDDFVSPSGVLRGTRSRGRDLFSPVVMIGRLNDFLDLEEQPVGSSGTALQSLNVEGEVLSSTHVNTVEKFVEDPAGGAMLLTDDFSDDQDLFVLTSYDEDGEKRFSTLLSPILKRGFLTSVMVDRLGNTLFICNLSGESATVAPQTFALQWVSHDGTVLPIFQLVGAPGNSGIPVVTRVGSGFFVELSGAWMQLEPLASTLSPAPAWLSAAMRTRNAGGVFMARNGRAYAMISLADSPQCSEQVVDLFAADGTSCGSVSFPAPSGSCQAPPLIGYDGTFAQPSNHCDGSTCTCNWRWWTGFFH